MPLLTLSWIQAAERISGAAEKPAQELQPYWPISQKHWLLPETAFVTFSQRKNIVINPWEVLPDLEGFACIASICGTFLSQLCDIETVIQLSTSAE